jgi:hypothetical protein
MLMRTHLYNSPVVSRTVFGDRYAIQPAARGWKHFFLKHPHEAGETYFQHFRFTLGVACRITLTGLILLVHGFLPFLFTKTTSTRIAAINRIIQERLTSLGEHVDTQFDI